MIVYVFIFIAFQLFLELCLERVRHENQGIVPACCASIAGRVLAKSFLARLAGVYIQAFVVRIK
jgi:hypothetical protein